VVGFELGQGETAVKHAGPDAIAKLAPLLERLRERDVLQEKRPGVFYLRSRAFLHFHEDPGGLFADVRLSGADFDRLRATTLREQDRLVRRIDGVLKEYDPPRSRRARKP